MTGHHRSVSKEHLADLGCTLDQWIELREIGFKMIAAGRSKDTVPTRAFCHQRHSARHKRNIPWQLALWDWWSIWRDSGRWDDRGLGRGYMMCRYGDVGPYAVGNVFIGPGVENLSAATKKTELPIGVAYRHGEGHAKPYRAYCNIGGKQRHLGSFVTVEEAAAAYANGLAADAELRAA